MVFTLPFLFSLINQKSGDENTPRATFYLKAETNFTGFTLQTFGFAPNKRQHCDLPHGCIKLPNLEMEPKCLMKSDVQLIPDILRTKNDKRVL